MQTRDEQKREYRAYRETARKLYEDVGQIDSEHIHIDQHANVQVTDTGAFVEAVVWVPKEKLPPPPEKDDPEWDAFMRRTGRFMESGERR